MYRTYIKHYVRSSHLDVFCKKGALRSFSKFTGKHLRQSLFFNKVACLKKIFLEISQNSRENTCASVSFLIKLQASLQLYLKRDSDSGVFPWILQQNFAKAKYCFCYVCNQMCAIVWCKRFSSSLWAMLPTTCIYVYFKWIINNPLFQNKLLNDLLHIQNCMKFNIFDLLLDLKYSIF